MGTRLPWFADPMGACRRLDAHQHRQVNLPLDLHCDQAAHPKPAGDGLFWQRAMGGKSIFNSASSKRHSAPSPIVAHLASCSSNFRLRREAEGAANPVQPPWTLTEPLPALGSVLSPAQRQGPVGALWDGASRV